MDHEPPVSPDTFDVRVDGVDFHATYDASQPGAYHYTRQTRPAAGYGFTSRRSDHQRQTMAAHVDAIRDFLGACHPVTGYLEDNPDDADA